MAGFSKLVSKDEESTIRLLLTVTDRFKEIVAGNDGRVFNTAGDAVLAEFSSSVDAVRCAIDVHEATKAACAGLDDSRCIAFRIGIAIGDVIIAANGDLLGDGVNVAARLQTIAEPGGTCISKDVYAHVHSKLTIAFEDLGFRELKNLSNPVHAFAIQSGLPSRAAVTSNRFRALPWVVAAAAGLLGSVALGAAMFSNLPKPSPAHPFVAEEVPFLSTATLEMLHEQFAKAPDHKALALARYSYGIVVSAESSEQANLQAMEKCETRSRGYCAIYSSDGSVVWPRPVPPMPSAQTVRRTPLKSFEPSQFPLLTSADRDRQLLANFVAGSAPKALAIGENGQFATAYDQKSLDDAERMALQRCGDLTASPCQLLVINDQVTQPIPAERKVKGFFSTVKWTAGASDADLRDYATAKDWRAAAHDENGHLYFATDQASETAAIAAASTSCAQRASGCKLIAIGDFLVEER